MANQREVVVSTANFTKKDNVNARNGFSLQDVAQDEILKINKAAIVMGSDKDSGNNRQVAVLMSDDGVVYTSISENVLDAMDDICELIDETGSVDIRVFKRKSKQGRDFISLSIL